MKRFCGLLVCLLSVSLLSTILVTQFQASATSNNESVGSLARTTTVATQKTAGIPLTRGAKVNGYTVTQKRPGSFEFGAVNVQDPVTRKPVTGNGSLQYKCGQFPYIGRLFFNKGNSDHIKVSCMVLITPRIIIED